MTVVNFCRTDIDNYSKILLFKGMYFVTYYVLDVVITRLLCEVLLVRVSVL